jgi:hypothetical protein
MVSFSHKDLLLEVVLSLVGLAFIWLSILQRYPFNLLPYYLLLFLPGYALISIIQPDYRLVIKMIIGIFLSLLLLLYLPVAFTYLSLTFLDGLLTTLLFLTAILFSLIAILSWPEIPTTNLEDYQLASDESNRLIKKIKKTSEVKNILSEEIGTYFPLYEQEPTLKNRMSIMLVYDTIERTEADKSKVKEEKVIDKKTIKDEILQTKQEMQIDEIPQPDEDEKIIEKTIRQPIHPLDKMDPPAFSNEIDKPPWMEGINDKKSDFRNWDLLLALLLSGLAVSFSYYLPLETPLQTTIAYYIVILFILTYTFLIVIVPDKSRIGLLYRILTSVPYAILLLVLVLMFGNSNMITALHFPLIMLFALATLFLVMAAILRRNSLHQRDQY